MADLPPTQQRAEPPAYRPISGLALTGFALGLLFAGMVVLNTLVALVKGEPFFLPDGVLALAVLAAVICLYARSRIRISEGTLAGLPLAHAGLWLSGLLGAACYTYTWATGLALTKQANDFLMVKSDDDTGVFPRLKNAGNDRTDLYQAFLLSLPLTSRGGSKAANEEAMLKQHDQPGKDGEGGNLSKFKKLPLVVALMKNPDIAIEPLGVLNWTYEKNAYHVMRNYRFRTPQLSFDTAVAVQSTETGGEGEQRKWFLDIARTPVKLSIKWTPLGEMLRALRKSALAFTEKWRTELAQGVPAAAYNEADTDWANVNIRPKKDEYIAHIKKALADIFLGRSAGPLRAYVYADENFTDCRPLADGLVQVVFPMRLVIPATGNFPNFNLELALLVQTKGPVDLEAPLPEPLFWEMKKISVLRASVAEKI